VETFLSYEEAFLKKEALLRTKNLNVKIKRMGDVFTVRARRDILDRTKSPGEKKSTRRSHSKGSKRHSS